MVEQTFMMDGDKKYLRVIQLQGYSFFYGKLRRAIMNIRSPTLIL